MLSEAVQGLRTELEKTGVAGLSPAHAEDLDLARAFGFPLVLLAFYRDCAPDSTTGMVELEQRIWSVQNAIAENRDYVPGAYLFLLGYVVFASTKFGDAYCVDTVHFNPAGDHPVVLLPHDTIEESTSLQQLERYRLVVAENLEDFITQFTQRSLRSVAKYS